MNAADNTTFTHKGQPLSYNLNNRKRTFAQLTHIQTCDILFLSHSLKISQCHKLLKKHLTNVSFKQMQEQLQFSASVFLDYIKTIHINTLKRPQHYVHTVNNSTSTKSELKWVRTFWAAHHFHSLLTNLWAWNQINIAKSGLIVSTLSGLIVSRLSACKSLKDRTKTFFTKKATFAHLTFVLSRTASVACLLKCRPNSGKALCPWLCPCVEHGQV